MTPRDPININFEAVGFESMYVLINLGSMLILFILFPSLAFLEVVMRFIPARNTQKASKFLRKKLYWNSSIRFFKESYAIALMCALINMKAFTSSTPGEFGSVTFAILIIVLAIVVPIILGIAIQRNFHQLKKKKVEELFGASYEHMKLEECNESEKKQLTNSQKDFKKNFFAFNSFYYFRRFLLGITIIYSANHLIW